jgi:hypothetical protein
MEIAGICNQFFMGLGLVIFKGVLSLESLDS